MQLIFFLLLCWATASQSCGAACLEGLPSDLIFSISEFAPNPHLASTSKSLHEPLKEFRAMRWGAPFAGSRIMISDAIVKLRASSPDTAEGMAISTALSAGLNSKYIDRLFAEFDSLAPNSPVAYTIAAFLVDHVETLPFSKLEKMLWRYEELMQSLLLGHQDFLAIEMQDKIASPAGKITATLFYSKLLFKANLLGFFLDAKLDNAQNFVSEVVSQLRLKTSDLNKKLDLNSQARTFELFKDKITRIQDKISDQLLASQLGMNLNQAFTPRAARGAKRQANKLGALMVLRWMTSPEAILQRQQIFNHYSQGVPEVVADSDPSEALLNRSRFYVVTNNPYILALYGFLNITPPSISMCSRLCSYMCGV